MRLYKGVEGHDLMENHSMREDISLVETYTKLVEEALEREKDWRKIAIDAVDIYESEKVDQNPFNILYSNTELLHPSIYSQVPKPIVQRRFKDADKIGKAVGIVVERLLEFIIDANEPEYATFDDVLSSAVLEGLVPGRGLTRVKFDSAGDRDYETVCFKEVPWDRFTHGYAKKWEDVPWVSFEHYMTEEDLEELLEGEEGADKLIKDLMDKAASGDMESIPEDSTKKDKTSDVDKFVHVYELWDKIERRVVYFSPDFEDTILEMDDPMQLQGFFPNPKPLSFYNRISGLVPQNLYNSYRAQAEELNMVSRRINMIMKALKVRGAYDASFAEMLNVMEADDNVLIPIANPTLMDGKKLEDFIYFVPIGELINVLQQLYVQRTQIKSVIFEITGLSDLLRGDTKASETAHAQELKNQWGSKKLRKMQKEVGRYAKELLRISAELAVTKLDRPTIAGMTGLQFPTAAQQQEAQRLIGAAEQEKQKQQQEFPPEIQQKLEEAQGILTVPSWEDVEEVAQSDLQRNYKIDIETDSTIEVESAEEKEEIGEFLNALAQFLNGVAPMVENGTMPFEVSKEILMAVTRRYRFGTELEASLEKMKAPEPQGPSEEEIQQQLQEIEKERQQLEEDKKKFEELQQSKEIELMVKEGKFEVERATEATKIKGERQEVIMQKGLAQKELQLASKAEELKRKLQTIGSGGSIDIGDESLSKVAETMTEGLFKLSETLSEGLVRIETTERVVSKGPENTMISEPVNPIAVEDVVRLESFEPDDPTEIEDPIVKMLQEGFDEVQTTLAQGIVEAANRKKTIQKQSNGDWETIINQEEIVQ